MKSEDDLELSNENLAASFTSKTRIKVVKSDKRIERTQRGGRNAVGGPRPQEIGNLIVDVREKRRFVRRINKYNNMLKKFVRDLENGIMEAKTKNKLFDLYLELFCGNSFFIRQLEHSKFTSDLPDSEKSDELISKIQNSYGKLPPGDPRYLEGISHQAMNLKHSRSCISLTPHQEWPQDKLTYSISNENVPSFIQTPKRFPAVTENMVSLNSGVSNTLKDIGNKFKQRIIANSIPDLEKELTPEKGLSKEDSNIDYISQKKGKRYKGFQRFDSGKRGVNLEPMFIPHQTVNGSGNKLRILSMNEALIGEESKLMEGTPMTCTKTIESSDKKIMNLNNCQFPLLNFNSRDKEEFKKDSLNNTPNLSGSLGTFKDKLIEKQLNSVANNQFFGNNSKPDHLLAEASFHHHENRSEGDEQGSLGLNNSTTEFLKPGLNSMKNSDRFQLASKLNQSDSGIGVLKGRVPSYVLGKDTIGNGLRCLESRDYEEYLEANQNQKKTPNVEDLASAKKSSLNTEKMNQSSNTVSIFTFKGKRHTSIMNSLTTNNMEEACVKSGWSSNKNGCKFDQLDSSFKLPKKGLHKQKNNLQISLKVLSKNDNLVPKRNNHSQQDKRNKSPSINNFVVRQFQQNKNKIKSFSGIQSFKGIDSFKTPQSIETNKNPKAPNSFNFDNFNVLASKKVSFMSFDASKTKDSKFPDFDFLKGSKKLGNNDQLKDKPEDSDPSSIIKSFNFSKKKEPEKKPDLHNSSEVVLSINQVKVNNPFLMPDQIPSKKTFNFEPNSFSRTSSKNFAVGNSSPIKNFLERQNSKPEDEQISPSVFGTPSHTTFPNNINRPLLPRAPYEWQQSGYGLSNVNSEDFIRMNQLEKRNFADFSKSQDKNFFLEEDNFLKKPAPSNAKRTLENEIEFNKRGSLTISRQTIEEQEKLFESIPNEVVFQIPCETGDVKVMLENHSIYINSSVTANNRASLHSGLNDVTIQSVLRADSEHELKKISSMLWKMRNSRKEANSEFSQGSKLKGGENEASMDIPDKICLPELIHWIKGLKNIKVREIHRGTSDDNRQSTNRILTSQSSLNISHPKKSLFNKEFSIINEDIEFMQSKRGSKRNSFDSIQKQKQQDRRSKRSSIHHSNSFSNEGKSSLRRASSDSFTTPCQEDQRSLNKGNLPILRTNSDQRDYLTKHQDQITNRNTRLATVDNNQSSLKSHPHKKFPPSFKRLRFQNKMNFFMNFADIPETNFNRPKNPFVDQLYRRNTEEDHTIHHRRKINEAIRRKSTKSSNDINQLEISFRRVETDPLPTDPKPKKKDFLNLMNQRF